MGKKSFLNLLIVSVVLGQGIVVASEDSKEASSALLIRQRRASGSSAEASTSSGVSGQKRKHSPDPPSRAVGTMPPPKWSKPLPYGMVKVYYGNKEVGVGVVVHPRTIVTKGHVFRERVQPGEYHVEYRGADGMTVSHDIIRAKACSLYRENKEEPWGPNDVGYADTDADMPKARLVSQLIKATGLFTREQVFWIASRTACIDGPADL